MASKEEIDRNLSQFLLGVVVGLSILTIFGSPYFLKIYEDPRYSIFYPGGAFSISSVDDEGGK